MRFLTISMISLIVLSSLGCLRTRSEVNQMETSKQSQTQISQLQTEKAAADNKVLVLQDEIRQLNGRLDMLERQAQAQGMNGTAGPTNADIIEQMKIFEQSNNQMKAKIAELEAKLAQAQKQKTVVPQKTAVPPVKKEKVKTKDTYQIAEEAFNKKEWKSAILNYQSYRDENPKGKRYAQATYKIGVSFQELEMKDEAKAFFEEVIQKFPKSPSARKSKFRLGQLK